MGKLSGEHGKYPKHLRRDEELKSYCYQLICDKVILKYKNAEIGIDDVEVTEEVLGD